MHFRTIEFGSEDFRKECQLREQVLRAPLGLSLVHEDLEAERLQQHFGLFDAGDRLVGSVIAVPLTSVQAKIRQMAIRDDQQGKGYGRQMMRWLEEHLLKAGFQHLFLHARLTAVGFYEKSGYMKVGSEFFEIGLPHLRMEKTLGGGVAGQTASNHPIGN